jgi:N-acyl-D-aspartate/D-glutamate deacylase
MNYIALLASFDAIASRKLDGIDQTEYDRIPIEGTPLFDLMVRDVLIFNGTGIPPFKGDIGINIHKKTDQDTLINSGVIQDIGDLSVVTGGRIEILAESLAVMPGFIAVGADAGLNELYKSGITTSYSGMDSASGQSILPPKEFSLSPDRVARYTSKPADSLELKKHGKIRCGNKADLVIFRMTQDRHFNRQNIRYVIKDGKIVFREPDARD